MFKKLALIVALLILVTIPASAFAWGNAVHTWLADNMGRQQGTSNFQELYGATLPDQFNFIFDPLGFNLAAMSHTAYQPVVDAAWKCRLRATAFGYAAHNDAWGADFTAHASGLTTPGEGYVIAKAAVLQPEVVAPLTEVLLAAGMSSTMARIFAQNLAPTMAHLLIESGVDLLLKEEIDRSIGAKMMVAASSRDPGVPDLVVAAYASTLFVAAGMTPEEAASYLIAVEQANREQMVSYGRAFNGSRAQAFRYLAGLGAAVGSAYLSAVTSRNVAVPVEMAAALTLRAREIVRPDYRDELSATLEYLAGALTANGIESCGPPAR